MSFPIYLSSTNFRHCSSICSTYITYKTRLYSQDARSSLHSLRFRFLIDRSSTWIEMEIKYIKQKKWTCWYQIVDIFILQPKSNWDDVVLALWLLLLWFMSTEFFTSSRKNFLGSLRSYFDVRSAVKWISRYACSWYFNFQLNVNSYVVFHSFSWIDN